MRVKNLRWLPQQGSMEAMAADHARTEKGEEAANAAEISFNSVEPVSKGRGRGGEAGVVRCAPGS